MSKGKRGRKKFRKPSPTPDPTPAQPQVRPEQLEPEPKPEPKPAQPDQPTSFFRRRDWLAFALATLISFGVYYYTLAPDLTLEDSGELAVGSMYAGVPHPPGYPMWTLYTWAFTKLPFGNIAWRVALSSAVAAALACGLLALMVSRSAQLMLKGIKVFSELKDHTRDAIGPAAGLTAGLLLAFNGFMWSQAVIVEVYTLGIFTFMAVLALMMRWYFRPNVRWPLYLAYFCFGLCFANHQTLLLAAIGIEAVVLLADRRLGKDFLLCNCGVYILGLLATLPEEGAPPDSDPGVFILFNLVGAGMMALLLVEVIRGKAPPKPQDPRPGPSDLAVMMSLAAGVYLLSSLLFGMAWSYHFGKGNFAGAASVVKAWAGLNALLLGAMVLYSWANRRAENDPGLLRHWLPLLNTRAAWLLGAAFYLYMPIASMTNPPMNWAYPRTAQGFKHAITRGQYDRIAPSNPTRMFYDRDHAKAPPNAAPRRTTFNGGQAYVYWEEAAQEFSLSYLLLAFLPPALLPWMALRERRWIAALTGIFVSFTLILIFLLNPTADEQNRHLFKVFFAATHIFIALGVGLGVALIAATLAMRQPGMAIGLLLFLVLLGGLDIWETVHVYRATDFAVQHAAAIVGLCLIGLLLLLTAGRVAWAGVGGRGWVALGVSLIVLLPVRPALSNWAVNEQRGHLFGYWYGHDMFSPPFQVFPEMDKNAILFGGTDPGRFAPTYMIFAESFTPAKFKRDKDFDRRDVYIITQNALADGTYLQYIRAHYNRSAQVDVDIFRNLSDRLADPDLRGRLYLLALTGLLLGAALLALAQWLGQHEGQHEGRRREGRRREMWGARAWGAGFILGALLALPSVTTEVANRADTAFTALGQRVEQARRARGVYPQTEIHTPTAYDNQVAFNDYLQDAMARMMRGQLALNENVTLNFPFQCLQCGARQLVSIDRTRLREYQQITSQGGLPCPRDNSLMPTPPNPQMQVRGNGSVMAINALLTKRIFEQNRSHPFYVEESFPLYWMYPYLTPHGIIMKLDARREFEVTSLTHAPINPTNAPTGLKVADELVLHPHPREDSLKIISPGKFLVEAVDAKGTPTRIRVENAGEFDLTPPRIMHVSGPRTNLARLHVRMEPIPGTPAHRLAHAKADLKLPGQHFQPHDVLHVFDSIQSASLQAQAPARLRVTSVDAEGGITGLEILQPGRYVIMPPRHLLLKDADGRPVRVASKLRRIPTHAELPEAMMDRDRTFWDRYTQRLIGNAIQLPNMTVKEICDWIEKTHLRHDLKSFNGDPAFLRDQQAQKGFSKLRGSIGNMYAWRMRISPPGSPQRKRYAREAEYAYRQSFALGAISPEAVIRYTELLDQLNRHRDSLHVILTFRKLDPHFPETDRMIAQTLEREISMHAAAHQMDKALEAARLLHQLLPDSRYHQLVESLDDALKANRIYLNRFQRDPGNAENFNRAVDIKVQSRALADLPAMIELFESRMTRNEEGLAALARAFSFLDDFEKKETVYQELAGLVPSDPVPWYDLASTQMRLKKTNAAAASLAKSLTLYHAGTATNRYDIPAFASTNALLAPLRERPEIKQLLEKKKD